MKKLKVKCLDATNANSMLLEGATYEVNQEWGVPGWRFYDLVGVAGGWRTCRFRPDVEERQLLGYRVKSAAGVSLMRVSGGDIVVGNPLPINHSSALRLLADWIDRGGTGKLVKVYRKQL